MIGFDPYNCTLKIRESFWDSNSQHGSSFGSVRVHALTLFALPGACEVIPGSPSWPATLQPPCLGCEPKARVVTGTLTREKYNHYYNKNIDSKWTLIEPIIKDIRIGKS